MIVMDSVSPPTEGRYGPTQTPGLKAEANGYTALCSCRWTRWWPLRSDATEGRLKHQKTCKKSGDVE